MKAVKKFKFDLTKTVSYMGVVGEGILRSNQATGLLMPEILSAVCNYNVITRNDGITTVCDNEGNVYKLFFGMKNTFNVSPSFAKGVGRSTKGILSFKYHLNKVSNASIFVKRVGNVCYCVIFNNNDLVINDKGIVNLSGNFNE